MKKYGKLIALLALACALAACASVKNFEDVMDKEWRLVGVLVEQQYIAIDRNKTAAGGSSEIFTLRFGDGRISGVGSPNRYFAPYSFGDQNTITIGDVAGTLMANLFEQENFTEYEYFTWLQHAERWNVSKGNLELYAKKNDGSQAILIFVLSE